MAVATARETILLLLVTLVSSAAVIDARPSRQRSSTLDWGGNSRGGLAMPSIPTDAHYSATSWAGPDSEPGIAISNSGGVDDPSARYEVYVPDGTGQMAHQLLTLTEIRSLLARQSLGDDHSAGTVDADAAQLYHHYAANSGTGSDALVASRASDAHDVHLISQLGKAASESSSSPAEGVIDSIPVSQLVASASADGAASTVVPNSNSSSSSAVSDVISSVMTIMATQMAQRDQLNDSKSSPVVVVMATDDHAASSSTTVVVPTTDNHSSQQPQTTTTSTTVVTESTTTVQMTSDQPKTTTSAESEGRTERVPVAAEAKEEDHHHHHDEHHHHGDEHGHHHHHGASSSATFDPLPEDNIGLRATSGGQERELNDLTMRSNRLAWRVWNEAVLQSTDGGVEANRIISPLALTTALGISFLGAGGSTAEAIDKALGLDSLTYRNPHLHLHQVANDVATLSSKSDQHFSSTQSHIVYLASASSSSSPTRGGSSSNGIKVRDIFRARLDTLYGASIVGNTSELSRLSASSTPATAADSPLWKNVQSAPFAIVSSAALNVAWPNSVKLTTPTGNEEEEDYLQFLNLPSSAQVVQGRRLVKVPTIRTTGAFYAGYDEKLDATTVALPLHPVRNADGEEEAAGNDGGASSADFFGPTSDALDQAGQLSLVLVMPGTAAKFDAGGTGLSALEKKLAAASASENGGGDAWERLLSQTKLHDHLVVELPQLSLHTESSLVGAMRAGAGGQLADVLFESAKADFGAMATSPSKQVPLYLADIIQLTSLNISSVATIGDDHHHHHHSDHEDNEAPVGRSEDGNRKKQQQQQKKNVVKPNKVQSTVKSPCEIFMEKYQNEKKEKENVTSTTEKPFTTTTKVQNNNKTSTDTSSGSRMRREAAGEEEMEDEEEETEQAIAPRLEEGEEEEHNHHHHDNHHHHHHQGEGHKQKVSFNRAFLYAVRHNPTGLLLMIGRYVHPDHHDIIGGHDEHDHHAHHGEEHHHEHHEHH